MVGNDPYILLVNGKVGSVADCVNKVLEGYWVAVCDKEGFAVDARQGCDGSKAPMPTIFSIYITSTTPAIQSTARTTRVFP